MSMDHSQESCVCEIDGVIVSVNVAVSVILLQRRCKCQCNSQWLCKCVLNHSQKSCVRNRSCVSVGSFICQWITVRSRVRIIDRVLVSRNVIITMSVIQLTLQSRC